VHCQHSSKPLSRMILFLVLSLDILRVHSPSCWGHLGWSVSVIQSARSLRFPEIQSARSLKMRFQLHQGQPEIQPRIVTSCLRRLVAFVEKIFFQWFTSRDQELGVLCLFLPRGRNPVMTGMIFWGKDCGALRCSCIWDLLGLFVQDSDR
jgi:hypothetical protein